jgi:hypothetical protein
MARPWGETEIIPQLFVGDLQDAVNFDGMIISVLADVPECEPRRSRCISGCWFIVKRVVNAPRWWSPGF